MLHMSTRKKLYPTQNFLCRVAGMKPWVKTLTVQDSPKRYITISKLKFLQVPLNNSGRPKVYRKTNCKWAIWFSLKLQVTLRRM